MAVDTSCTPALIAQYFNKISNGNVTFHKDFNNQFFTYCKICGNYKHSSWGSDNNEFFDFIIAFCESHRWCGSKIQGGWVGELVFNFNTKIQTPSLNQDTIKLLAKYSNFNVDAQARQIAGDYEYRLVCGKCKQHIILERQNLAQWLARLGFEGEINPVRDFCKQHSHGALVLVDEIVAEIVNGRKFRNE